MFNSSSNDSNQGLILKFVIVTAVTSLFLTLWDSLISIPFVLQPLSTYFSLSLTGFRSLYLWQFITYPFAYSTQGSSIHILYLFSLFFILYFIWILGTGVYNHAGKKQFVRIYFISAILSGAVAVFFMWLRNIDMKLSGPIAPLLTLFTCWTFLYPDMETLLLFVIPVRIKWVFAGLMGVLALLTLGQLDLISLMYYITAVIIGYGCSTVVWGISSPFPFTQKMDQYFIALGEKIRTVRGTSLQANSKILDISTGNSVADDDEFVDEMLQKISKKGQSSLSWAERKRLDQIAKKKEK